MSRPTQEQVDSFVRITGASVSLAIRKLEEYGGNLAEAINAHFREVEPYMSNQLQGRRPGFLPLITSARNFRPSLLLDPDYRRNLFNQIGASVFPSREPQFSHTGGYNNSHVQPHHASFRPVIEDVSGPSLFHGPHPYGNNTEEEMIQIAIEASKQESFSGTRPPNFHPEDDEFARAVALSLKTAEQEKVMHERTVEAGKKQGVNLSSGREKKTRKGKGKLKPESSSLQEVVQHVQEQPFGDISSQELDEALILEKAFFGENAEMTSFQRTPYSQSVPDRSTGLNPERMPRPPSPSVVAQRLLREQQDEEYLASLLADREREMSTSKEIETSCLKKGESQNKMHERMDFEKMLEEKKALLHQEPAVDDVNAVTLLVRMPDGSRIGRRFLKSDKLQFLFDFIDVSKAVKPGTYRVVRPYPKHVFCVSDCSLSLNELGLISKQEALFLELI